MEDKHRRMETRSKLKNVLGCDLSIPKFQEKHEMKLYAELVTTEQASKGQVRKKQNKTNYYQILAMPSDGDVSLGHLAVLPSL